MFQIINKYFDGKALLSVYCQQVYFIALSYMKVICQVQYSTYNVTEFCFNGSSFIDFLYAGLKFLVRLCSDLGLKDAQTYATKLKKAEKAKELKEQVK